MMGETMQRDGASAEDGGIERSLLRSTLRSLLLPRRLVPILLLGAVLVIAQERFSSDPAAVWLGALMCLVFALVAPVSWRALFPPALDAPPTFAAPFGRLLVYGITGIGTVLMDRTLRSARNRGVATLYMVCLRENGRMQRIARKFDAALHFEQGEISGTFDTASPDFFSIMRESLDDGSDLVTALIDNTLRQRA